MNLFNDNYGDDPDQAKKGSDGASTDNQEEQTPQSMGAFLHDDGSFFAPLDSDPLGMGAEAIDYRDLAIKSESIQARIQRVSRAEDPLLEAVQPLLRALSELPDQVSDLKQVEILKKSLKNEIATFTAVCDAVSIAWQKMAIIRYAICTAIDESVHSKAWGLASGWSQSNLLNHFEGDNDGGNKFFLLIGRLSMNPQEYTDVLDILSRILGLGFEGRYSIIENGDRQLNKIRQRLLSLQQSTRDSVPAALSPNATVTQDDNEVRRVYLPVRISMIISGFILISLFALFKYWLMVDLGEFNDRVASLKRGELKHTQLAIAVPRLRLAILLKDEIAKGLVTVDETGPQSIVTFRGDAMFLSGKQEVKPEMDSILVRVADEVKRVDGKVVIAGHTDSVPIGRAKFASNEELSLKRAESVGQFFVQTGIPSQNIQTKGMGASQPVSSNKDEQGRALNRRVEVYVTYL